MVQFYVAIQDLNGRPRSYAFSVLARVPNVGEELYHGNGEHWKVDSVQWDLSTGKATLFCSHVPQ